jgi:hypothetical protein
MGFSLLTMKKKQFSIESGKKQCGAVAGEIRRHPFPKFKKKHKGKTGKGL